MAFGSRESICSLQNQNIPLITQLQERIQDEEDSKLHDDEYFDRREGFSDNMNKTMNRISTFPCRIVVHTSCYDDGARFLVEELCDSHSLETAFYKLCFGK